MPVQRRPSAQAGFTLIEVLVSALIVAVLATTVATALTSSTHASGQERQRATADTLAVQDQERMRGLSDQQLSGLGGGGQNRTQTMSGAQYTINSTTAAVDASGASSCTGQGAADFHITSTVSWTDVGGSAAQQVQVDSLMARPTTGDVVAVATDETGAPLPGVTATVNPTSSDGSPAQTSITDANGCSVFAGLASGAYTLSFSKLGYVDKTGSATPAAIAVAVTATGTPTVNTQALGSAGAINASLTTSGIKVGSTVYQTSGDADAIGYLPNGQSTSQATADTGTFSTFQLSNLYPFPVGSSTPTSYTGDYTLWAGACPQQKPASSATVVTVSPASAVSANVPEPQLNIQRLTVGSTTVIPTAPFAFTFASATNQNPSCSDTWTAAAAAGTTAPATGWLADPGQPYADGTTGILTACVTYKSGTTTKYGRATVTNTNFTTAPSTQTLSLGSPTTPC